ncbi:MAG: JAB domain-containing protein [Candidatus Taylorbacteria bacterium]|nr:JAB domain-containing protein [Candidatus Taylorbacteria bacterium]
MTYTLSDTDLLTSTSYEGLDTNQKDYSCKIRDLPTEDRPREKMLNNGVASLSLVELFAVVLQTGTKKEGVLDMSYRIIREYGNSAVSNQADPESIAKDLQIPHVKACQIVACVEIGRRLFKKNDMGLTVIRNARDVYDYLIEMRTLQKEQLCGLYLDTHNRIIHQEIISIGTLNSNLVHPREVFKPALEYGAASVVLAHNHPSGVLEPSTADVEVTKQLIQAGRVVGIHLMDHLVIGKTGFVSIQAEY